MDRFHVKAGVNERVAEAGGRTGRDGNVVKGNRGLGRSDKIKTAVLLSNTAIVESTIKQVVSKRFSRSSRCSGHCGSAH
jgi:hypothetical protein